MEPPTPESLPELIQALGTGRTTVAEVIERCLASNAVWEPDLHAFAWLDRDVVSRSAQMADKIGPSSKRTLHGVQVGVKDLFDTAGIPTDLGPLVFKGRIPPENALAVAGPEATGAIVFGKTVS